MLRVTGPTAPFAIVRFSTTTTGSTPQLEFVRKTSSEAKRSSALIASVRASRLSSAASSSTTARVIPGRTGAGAASGASSPRATGVRTVPFETTKTLLTHPDAFFESGVKELIAAARANPRHPMAGHKTLDYWPRIRVLQDAGRREGAEAIWLSLDAEVASGCVSNVFVVSNGSVRTPVARGEEAPDAAPAPVRPGITRAVVLELAAERGLEARAEAISAEDLFAADEVFLTNSSWGVLPVVVVEKRTIADGAVGPVTRSIRDAWSRLVDAETLARA